MIFSKDRLGYFHQDGDFLIFFGGKDSQLMNLKNHYSHLQFTRVKQIHSDVIVESQNTLADLQVIADGHTSTSQNLALCVITADCLPVLFYNKKTGHIAGTHAGWRGVANRIIPKTIQKLKADGNHPEDIQVIIGPHIQKESFQVDKDVRDQLLNSVSHSTKNLDRLYENQDQDKYLVDLHEIALFQIKNEGIPVEKIESLKLNTFQDSFFHSHRRDREKAGRQISFICRTVRN